MEADESSLLSLSDPNFDIRIEYENDNDNKEISQVGCMMFTEISLVINLFTQLLSEATASESGVSQHLSEPQASLSSVSLCSPQIDDTSQHSPDSPPSPSNEESLPEARFEIKVTTGKFGKMKGKERRQVTLVLENNRYRLNN